MGGGDGCEFCLPLATAREWGEDQEQMWGATERCPGDPFDHESCPATGWHLRGYESLWLREHVNLDGCVAEMQ